VASAGPYASLHLTPAPHHSVFTGRMPFLPPSQQRQSTEGNIPISYFIVKTNLVFGVGSSPGDRGRGLETEILRS